MSRLCIIGNSHITAVKDGWPKASPITSEFSPTYFAAPGNWMAEMEVHDGKLTLTSERGRRLMALSSGGATEIDPTAFDAFLLVGMFVRLRRAVKVYQTHRMPAHADKSHRVISRATLGAAVAGHIEESAAANTIAKLRTLTKSPVGLIPEPLPSENIIPTDRFWEGDYMPFLHDVYMEQLHRFVEKHGVDLAVQAPDSMVRGAFTNARYSIGAVRLRGGNVSEQEDFQHMNADFGAEILRDLLPRLARNI